MSKRTEGKRSLFVLKCILMLASIFALLYYIVILSILGFRKDFSLLWPTVSLCCIAFYGLFRILEKREFRGILHVTHGFLILLAVIVVLFGIVEGIVIHTGFQEPDKNADYLIVLGAQVNGTTVSKALRYRLDEAYEYAKENANTKVIVSGGQGIGEEVSEAQAMHDYLVNKGIEENRILLEDKSTSTNENIKYSKAFLDNADYVIVVTNRFHLYRGIHIARKQLDMKVEGLGADTGTILFINYYVREVFAIGKDKLIGNI